MTIRQTEEDKGISVISLILVILLVGGIASAGYIYWSYKQAVYSIGESIAIDGIGFKINSLRISEKVAGYRAEVPGAEIKTGNQTAHAEQDSTFVIIGLTINNKENKITPVPRASSMLLETGVAKFYSGNSIFDVFQTKSRASPTAEELANFYCKVYPESLNPESSETTCVIFHVKEDEKPVKFRHVDQKGKTVFVVNLV